MRRPPSIAVIIPAYNAAKTLDRTLGSAVESLNVCRSKIPGVEGEVAVVDDRSTDTTLDLGSVPN